MNSIRSRLESTNNRLSGKGKRFIDSMTRKLASLRISGSSTDAEHRKRTNLRGYTKLKENNAPKLAFVEITPENKGAFKAHPAKTVPLSHSHLRPLFRLKIGHCRSMDSGTGGSTPWLETTVKTDWFFFIQTIYSPSVIWRFKEF